MQPLDRLVRGMVSEEEDVPDSLGYDVGSGFEVGFSGLVFESQSRKPAHLGLGGIWE